MASDSLWQQVLILVFPVSLLPELLLLIYLELLLHHNDLRHLYGIAMMAHDLKNMVLLKLVERDFVDLHVRSAEKKYRHYRTTARISTLMNILHIFAEDCVTVNKLCAHSYIPENRTQSCSVNLSFQRPFLVAVPYVYMINFPKRNLKFTEIL